MIQNERNKYQDRRSFEQRVVFAALFMLLCFGLLFMRFVWLQVLHYDNYATQAETNRIAVLPIVPARGAIIDRNGVVLAYNAPTYTIEITPIKVRNLDETIAQIGDMVVLTARDIRRFHQALGNARRRFMSVPLRANLTQEDVARLSAQLYRLPGVEINARFIRQYPLGETASHVLGYIGGITSSDQDALEESGEANNYRGTQEIGRVGIEASYERVLHGTTGVEEVEITAAGRPVRRLREVHATPGETVQLTLDVRLQRLVETLYGERRGAFVAIDPRNGEILALVSKPTFDPNQFIEGFDQETWAVLNDALARPLFHRAIAGTYPIGSTYKPFMALAGLQTGQRKPTDIIMDRGVFELGGRVWRSPIGESGGPMDVTRAIIKSSNVYFYSLAYELGVNTIHDFMKPWGFGSLTGIDLPGEVSGILPSTEWKRQVNRNNPAGQRWYDGETVNLGIGQGHNRFTMIQLANAVATLANNGSKNQPHLLLDTIDTATGQVSRYEPPQAQAMDVKMEFLQIVQNAMTLVPVQGTARLAFIGAPYASGGKTGTAQAASVPAGTRYNASTLAEYKRDHSLYIAFAPAENPTIAIAMIVENAGFGARAAVPIARRAIDYHLLGIYPSETDIKAVQQGYAGMPQGTPRAVQTYDIVLPQELVALSTLTGSSAPISPSPSAGKVGRLQKQSSVHLQIQPDNALVSGNRVTPSQERRP